MSQRRRDTDRDGANAAASKERRTPIFQARRSGVMTDILPSIHDLAVEASWDPEKVEIRFPGRDDLILAYSKTLASLNVQERLGLWEDLIGKVRGWAREGALDPGREEVFAALLWAYSKDTEDYTRSWKEMQKKRGKNQ